MRLFSLVAGIAASSMLLTGTATAKSKAPPPAIVIESPPVASDIATDAIFDAAVAIGEAQVTYPAGADRAAKLYATALVRYRAGDLASARQIAMQAVASSMPTVTAPSTLPPTLTSSTQADAESYLALARGALAKCGANATLNARYAAAAQETLGQRYGEAITDARAIIQACAQPQAGT